MELKFYYDYNEFIENWKNDYMKWKEKFPNCTENSYLEELAKKYDPYLTDDNKVKNTIKLKMKGRDTEAYIMYEFSSIVSPCIEEECIKRNIDAKTLLIDYELWSYNIILHSDIFGKIEFKSSDLMLYKNFFETKDNIFYLDCHKWKDFSYSLPLILNYINEITLLKKEQTKETIPTEQIQKTKFKTNITQTELVELVKALVENGTIEGTQKDIIKDFADFFGIEINNPNKLITDLKKRNNGSETLFLDKLKNSLMDYIIK